MAEPRFDRFRIFSWENNDPNVHEAVGRRPRSDLPYGLIRSDPVHVRQERGALEVRGAAADDEPVLRDVPKEREPARRQLTLPLGLDRSDEMDDADRHPPIVHGPRDWRCGCRDVNPTGRKLKGR